MSNIHHNRPLEWLADNYGNIKSQIDALENVLKPIKDELRERINDAPAVGEIWTVTKTESVTKRLDTKALKEALGDEIISEYEKESTTTTLRLKPTVRARGWEEE
jgi:predicted phage-related endonuclease